MSHLPSKKALSHFDVSILNKVLVYAKQSLAQEIRDQSKKKVPQNQVGHAYVVKGNSGAQAVTKIGTSNPLTKNKILEDSLPFCISSLFRLFLFQSPNLFFLRDGVH